MNPFSHTLANVLGAAVTPFDQIHSGSHWIANKLLNDPQLAYGGEWQGSRGPLGSVPGSANYANVLGNMQIAPQGIPDARMQALINVLRGMTMNASRAPYSQLEQTVMRGLNPQNVRAYGG